MADRDEILDYASELLDLDAYPDYGPMGMQVAGAPEVDRIACGVSSSLELFERAAAAGAQMLLVHHGLLWDRDSRVIDDAMRRRLKTLLDAGDHAGRVPPRARRASRARQQRADRARARGRALGAVRRDRLRRPADGACLRDEFAARVRERLGSEPVVFAHGPERIERAAVITGGAARYLADAAREGYDLFLTGEPAEPSLHTARELGIHFVAAGHYATERIGIQALAKRLAEQFHLEWEFIDLPNPV